MSTEALFREDPYLRSCEAAVIGVNPRGGVLVDRTVFYPTGGGQPGDHGTIRFSDGRELQIATTVKGDGPEEIVHVPAEPVGLPDGGEHVTLQIDWARRYRHMRIHTCLHLLSVAVPFPVTGGQIAEEYGRLDFSADDAKLDKDELTERLQALVAADHPVSAEWISDAELEAKPELVKTMSVKPPRGSGRVRLIRIGDIDLQPCGGTHVARTGEIGRVAVTKIESKGAQNRRVRVTLLDEA
ncbi:alanyl-tRNA editing protein [Lutibaculum baratangense]|uniref:Alanine--tRNA ligase n=1 Tax=Lutibaculum baratangense AMV1 TaxID=631454 RepID=V4QUA2_9HYPH|nr:alanyl-tRNA editing protein [Lutibaculum baratangense]ESR23347.1 Ser-tRNA(Ala) deacylase [Lutibaculum baratangense AMV1]